MADHSNIEWTDATWNPVTGCTKISPGCAHCYAETFAERFRGVPGHPYEQGFDLKLWPQRLEMPLHWKKPRRIFVNSMSDLFHNEVPDDFIKQVFETMERAKHHTFQVLTKRAERLEEWTNRYLAPDKWPSNVWLGVSVESDEYRWRIKHLQRTPGGIRFLSVEPLIGPLSLNGHFLHGIHWVIVGGESGPNARRMKGEWASDVQRCCQDFGVAFFFKQWGAYDEDGMRTGKKRSGRSLAGRSWDEMPTP